MSFLSTSSSSQGDRLSYWCRIQIMWRMWRSAWKSIARARTHHSSSCSVVLIFLMIGRFIPLVLGRLKGARLVCIVWAWKMWARSPGLERICWPSSICLAVMLRYRQESLTWLEIWKKLWQEASPYLWIECVCYTGAQNWRTKPLWVSWPKVWVQVPRLQSMSLRDLIIHTMWEIVQAGWSTILTRRRLNLWILVILQLFLLELW